MVNAIDEMVSACDLLDPLTDRLRVNIHQIV